MDTAVRAETEVDARLRGLLRDVVHREPLLEFVRRGKRVRSWLAQAATRAAGGSECAGVTAAAALELLHSAALIQDDVMDAALTRRGAAAMHLQFGNDVALMLADQLIGAAFELLAQPDAALPAHGHLQGVGLVAQCVRISAQGQVRELAPHDPFDAGATQHYMRVVAEKTAVQFATASTLGAVLSGCAEPAVRALRRYGEAVGMAFQITDDVLDIRGDPVEMGKPSGNSVAAHRPLLPLIILARVGDERTRAELRGYVTSGERWPEVARRLMDQPEVWTEIAALQQRLVADACNALCELPDSAARDGLRAIAHAAADRYA